MAANTVDSMLVPGMMEMKVGEALPKLETMCNEMKESTILCQAVASRLRFLHGHPDAIMDLSIPATYANAIGTTIKLVKNNSSKDLLHRIAASRSVLSGLREVHQKIDRLFEDLQLANAPEMTDWKDNWDDGVHKQTEQFFSNITSYKPFGDASTLEEAVTVLKYELERKREENSDEHIKVIEAAFEIQGLPIVPDLPTNFILRDDLDVQAEPFGEGSIGAVFDGMLGRQKQRVIVKRFLLDSNSVQSDFLQETRIAHTLDHPSILKSLGACHVGNPVFTVCEYAAQGNLLTYFANPAHRSDFWQLFLEAAQGLLYLHKRSIIHGGLRSSNILVSSDGTAKISDAGYSNIRRMSVGRSLKGGTNSTRWMAPECLLEQGRNAEPSFASDIYSLGMTMIEAKTGKHPWPDQKTDEDVINVLAGEVVYERPQEHFTSKEWELVMALCQCDRTARIPLEDAIEILTGLASTRHYCQNPSCPLPGPDKTRFCGECGAVLVMGVLPGIEMDIDSRSTPIPNGVETSLLDEQHDRIKSLLPWHASTPRKRHWFPHIPSKALANALAAAESKTPTSRHPFERHSLANSPSTSQLRDHANSLRSFIDPRTLDVTLRIWWRILPTHYFFWQQHSDTQLRHCAHGCTSIETYRHLFWECQHSRTLWTLVLRQWRNFLTRPIQ